VLKAAVACYRSGYAMADNTQGRLFFLEFTRPKGTEILKDVLIGNVTKGLKEFAKQNGLSL
jgi:hypothetical protein